MTQIAPAVHDHQAKVVLGIEQVMEALREEHRAGRTDVLRGAKEVGLAFGAAGVRYAVDNHRRQQAGRP